MAKRRRTKPKGQDALEAVGLTKTYGDLVALAPLDLRIPDGEILALVGHNGSGKSTLLQLAAGLLEPTGGSISIHGSPAGSLPARAALSYIGDNPILYDDLSVWEHLEYLAGLHRVADWQRRSKELVERLGLAERVDDLPARFSRGLRQKTALAIGLVREARVLLVDEPFVGLDATGKQALLSLVDDCRSAGTTVVLATHDLEVLERADRCVALRNGVVVHDGDAEPGTVLSVAG
jgi:ABC-2 type transport system ATP-binding protein